MNRFLGKSISSRLNIWYTTFIFLLSAGLLLSVVTVARMAQNSEAQQNLIRSVERNIDEIEIENGLLDIESDFAYRSGDIHALVYSSDGKILGGEYPQNFSEDIPLEAERFDKINGFYIYDTKVEFTKYDFKINGETGEIISSEVEGADFYTPYEGSLDFLGEDCNMTCGEAFDIILKDSGLSHDTVDVINIKDYEYEDEPIYEIEFYSTQKAYDDIWVRGVAKATGMNGIWGVLVRLAAVLIPLIIAISAFIGRIITKKALEPIKLLSDAVEETQSGNDLTKHITIPEGDPIITQLTNSFNNMFGRLRQSFEAERQFSGDVSHELRTPTAVILAECEYQLSREELDDEDKEGFESIQKQAESMKHLISQLLEITRIEQNRINPDFEKEDFSLLVSAVVEEVSVIDTKNTTLNLDVEDGIMMDMDVLLMTRLVSNLLSNAFNYGKENGTVGVTLKKSSDGITLSVSDDGIGIDKEHLDKIWNRFFRADKSRCRENGCSGLGLPMVKQIALLHGGEVSVESEKGKGSIFTVKFKN